MTYLSPGGRLQALVVPKNVYYSLFEDAILPTLFARRRRWVRLGFCGGWAHRASWP